MPGDDSTGRNVPTPPVIGLTESAPEGDAVYLPSERVQQGDAEATVELRRLEDGRLVVLAYTSLQALVEGCGERQPWLSVRGEYLEQIVTGSGAAEVLWNAVLPDEQRQDAPVSEGRS
ncbi:SAV_915 family protein [Prauserella flavalba]|uniref:SAV_915 family protein n=1 Tax=Prauserella flavalba TaxID=1477506 RepID=UPI0011B7E451|nr:SAV_915 family protein [Prauserella flavalba]